MKSANDPRWLEQRRNDLPASDTLLNPDLPLWDALLMTTNAFEDLPSDVKQQLLSLLGEVADEVIVPDENAFIEFIREYGKSYPVLFELLKLNQEAVQGHYERTGEAPPGIKMTMTSHRPDTNVVDLRVIYGSKTVREA